MLMCLVYVVQHNKGLYMGIRRFIGWGAAVFAVSFACTATAQSDWPSKPITFIVPSAAGGSPDILSRLIGAQLAKDLNTSIVIENRPGAYGSIGMSQVLRASPNGYTVGYGNTNTLAVNSSLYDNLPYDVDRDLTPVAQMLNISNVLVVRGDSPDHTLKDLIARAKKNPGKLSYGAPGVGTSGHTGGELFKSMAKVDILFVPYNSGPTAMQDLLGGRLDFIIANTAETLSLIQSGKVRPLGVTSLKRIANLPDVPTMDEQGLTGYEAIAWAGIVVSNHVPREIVEKLNSAIQKAVRNPKVSEGLVALGVDPVTGSAGDFKKLIDTDTVKWKKVIEVAGIKKPE